MTHLNANEPACRLARSCCAKNVSNAASISPIFPLLININGAPV